MLQPGRAGANRGAGARAAAPTGPIAYRYGIVERTLAFGSLPQGEDRWDVPVTVTLTAPSGTVTQIGGFYYGDGTWVFRFSPPEPGLWRWSATLSYGTVKRTLAGSFATQSQATPGFVRPSRFNRYLWSFEDGSPYYPLGLQACLRVSPHYGPPLTFILDGGLRSERARAAGRWQPGAGGRRVSLDAYVRTYASAGFNLFRWSVDNCGFSLYRSISPTGNVYSAAGGRYGDQLVRALHKYGMRVYMTFFGFNPPKNRGPATMAAVLRYVRYVVARYGAYVDFWELMNEARRSQFWYRTVTSYLRSIDPYHHPISTSRPPSDLSDFDIDSPHWYQRENELNSDLVTYKHFERWKAAGKPVIVGEQGNAIANWDPRSGVRMRLRMWTAFFSQGSLIFWNETAFRDYEDRRFANIWIGPTERRYASVLQRFVSGFDPRAVMARARVNHSELVRGYELGGPSGFALYLTAYTTHSELTRRISVSIDPAFGGTARWTDPATGRALATRRVPRGRQRLKVPTFSTDIALKILP